jgi:ppGpp synthetase/RelA/SpoT-type nucleotidyltranferase
MSIPQRLRQRFNECQPLLDRVERDVKQTLQRFCEERGYALVSRRKGIRSLAEKIETGRFSSWSEIDDLFACTIVVPTLAHEREVIQFCSEVFLIELKQRGGTPKSPREFRFDSTRITAHLKRPEPAQQKDAIAKMAFEVQVKSAFDHAWSVSTHALTYKSNIVDWRRQRIAAQIKAVVEQLDTLLLAFERAIPVVDESPYQPLQDQALIAQSVEALFEAGLLPSELRPKDLSRFSENFYALLRSSSKRPETPIALNHVRSAIESTPRDKVPRSLSLLQYFSAILFEMDVIAVPLKRYRLHITEELLTLYPTLSVLEPRFQYD